LFGVKQWANMAKKRIEIIVETERIVITGATPRLVWCERCNDSSFEVSLEQAAIIARVSSAELQREVKVGRLHYWRGGDERLLICLSSLTKASS
jgi:hypothetical protein